jgi:hypothetical protein
VDDSEKLHLEAAAYADDRMAKHKTAVKKHPEDFYRGNWIAHYEGYIAGYKAREKNDG